MAGKNHNRHAIRLLPDGRFKVIGEAIAPGHTMTLKVPGPGLPGHPPAPQCATCAVLSTFTSTEWNAVADDRDEEGKLKWLEFVYDPKTGKLRGH